jgi:hypothetical protein
MDKDDLVSRGRVIASLLGYKDGATLESLRKDYGCAIDAIEQLLSSQSELLEALREARDFVVIHGPAAAFPELITKWNALLERTSRHD